jgi:hypothetical protein
LSESTPVAEPERPSAAPSDAGARSNALWNLFWRLAAGLALVQALTVLAGLMLLLPVRFDLSFPEGAVIARVIDVAEGRTPYTDWREWPHAFAPYGPLTYYPPGWLARAAPGIDAVMDYYRFGRVHSLIFLMGVWALLVGLGRRDSLPWIVCLIAPGLFSGWRWLQEFAFSFRPDAPQVFFSLLAVWVASGGKARGSRLAVVMACLMVSFWFKPTSWGVAVALWVWTAGGLGRIGASFAWGAFGLAGLAAALGLNALLNGTLVLNMLGVTDVGWDPLRLMWNWREFPPIAAGVLIVAVGGAVHRLRRGGLWQRGDSLLPLAFLFSLGFALLQYAKAGADRNYFLEAYAIGCVIAVRALWVVLGREGRTTEKRVLCAVLLLVAVTSAGLGLRGIRDEVDRSRRLSQELPGLDSYRSDGQLVLAYHPYLSLALSGEPSILDAFQYNHLALKNRSLETSLLDRIRDEAFDLIIVPRNAEYLYTSGFIPLLREHYVEKGLLGPNAVYLPRGEGNREGSGAG